MRFLNIVFIALTLVFITPPQILAQSTPNDPIFVCGNTADNTVLPITPPCVNNTPWDNLLTYRPYDQNAPVLWVKVNFIFLQTQVMLEPDGRKTRGNFDFDIPEDEAFVKNAVADMNARIRDINIPVNPDCFNPNDLATGQHILNGKIQFDVAYYFVEDGYLWDIGNMNTNAFYCPTGLNGWVNGIYGGRAETMLADEGIRDGINIIFGQEGIPYETIVNQRDFSGGLDGNNDGMIVFSEFASSTDCSQLPSLTDFDQIQWVAMNNEYFAYRYKQIADESSTDDLVSSRSHYDVGRVLLHELGHSLGIPGIAHVTDCTENVMSSAGEI